MQYRLCLALAVANLFDKMQPVEPIYTAHPYYNASWFDSLGLSFYLGFTYKFGGAAL